MTAIVFQSREIVFVVSVVRSQSVGQDILDSVCFFDGTDQLRLGRQNVAPVLVEDRQRHADHEGVVVQEWGDGDFLVDPILKVEIAEGSDLGQLQIILSDLYAVAGYQYVGMVGQD